MYTITTLDRLRDHLGITDDGEDARLLVALESASVQVERLSGRRYVPRHATLHHDVSLKDVTTLTLDDDLLALDSLSNGDGTPLPLADVLPLPCEYEPASTLRLLGGRAFTWGTSPSGAVEVTGTWGWHTHYANAWRGTGDVVMDNPLPAGVMTLHVSDADGRDAAGRLPRFQVGQTLRIESEYLRVLAITPGDATDMLTVRRGVGGTTTTSHLQGTVIESFQPNRDVESLVLRWAAWLYREPDTAGVDAVPEQLLAELHPLRRDRVKV